MVNNVDIREIFKKLLEDEKFRNTYYLGYLDRFVYSATDLEEDITLEKRKILIENLLEAFNKLMDSPFEKMSPFDFVEVSDIVNKNNGIDGLRRINVSAGKYALWEPVAPSSIMYSLYSLLDNYYNIWNIREVYEKEAAFHIKFMRIHPFEDGNKRTAKIILNTNLVKQNYPPVIINESDTELYYNFINNEDVLGFAKFLKSKSLQELNTLISYYKIAYNIPITSSVVETFQSERGRK